LPDSTTLYKAMVEDILGCWATDSRAVQLRRSPEGKVVSDISSGCAPVCVNFAAIPSGNSASFQSSVWDFGDGNSTGIHQKSCFATAGAKDISVLVTDVFGCSSTISVQGLVNVYPNPIAEFDAIARKADVLDPSIRFIQQSTDADFYSWNFGDGTVSNEATPVHLFPDTGRYQVCLKVSTTYGCTDFVCDNFTILPVPVFYAPSAFTPDGDQRNDRFKIITTYTKEFRLEIFDRWGELIYSGTDSEEGWDGTYRGTKAQLDMYVWRVTLVNTLQEEKKFDGRVTLIAGNGE